MDDAEHFCQWMLESFEHEGATVMMAPAAGFYATEGLGRNQVRIAYVLELEALRHAVDCIAAGLRVYQAPTNLRKPCLRRKCRGLHVKM